MAKEYEGMWDFAGSCAPAEGHAAAGWPMQETFSLGCFQWVRRGKNGTGTGLKPGKVQYRIKGRVDNSAEAYERARAFCAKKNKEERK